MQWWGICGPPTDANASAVMQIINKKCICSVICLLYVCIKWIVIFLSISVVILSKIDLLCVKQDHKHVTVSLSRRHEGG